MEFESGNKQRATTLAQRRQQILTERPDLTNSEHQNLILKVLQKSTRSKQELNFLVKGFQDLKFFTDQREIMPENLYMSMFRELGHQFVNREHPVFNYGDFGHSYYIILRGSVTILIPKEEALMEMVRENKQENFLVRRASTNRSSFVARVRQQISKGSKDSQQYRATQQFLKRFSMAASPMRVHKDSIPESEISSDDEVVEDHSAALYDRFISEVYADFTPVRVLNVGDSFGEIALVTRSKRTATIVCREDCDFMILSKQSFDKILGEQHNQQMQAKLDFFLKFPFLKQVPTGKLMSLIHQMVHLRPKLHDIIYREGDPSQAVYFLLEGEVEISKSLALQEHSQLNLLQRGLQRQGQQKQISLSILTKGACFGQDELLHDQPRKARATSKCTETLLYALSKSQFMGLLDMHHMVEVCRNVSDRMDEQRDRRLQRNVKATQKLMSAPNEQKVTASVTPDISRLKVVDSDSKKKVILQRINTSSNMWDLGTEKKKTSSAKLKYKHMFIDRFKMASHFFITNPVKVLESQRYNQQVELSLLQQGSTRHRAIINSFNFEPFYVPAKEAPTTAQTVVNIHTHKQPPKKKKNLKFNSLQTLIGH